MSKIITQQIYRKKGGNPKLSTEYKKLAKEHQELEQDYQAVEKDRKELQNTKKDVDKIFINIATILEIKKGDKDFTYEGIYNKLTTKIGKPKKG